MTSKSELLPLLEKQRPEIRALAERLRALIQASQPEMEEDASLRLGVIYYRHKGVVCALGLHKQHINLHFYKGTQLEDPAGLLQGGGKGLRHLKFETDAEIRPEVIEPMVRQAYTLNG